MSRLGEKRDRLASSIRVEIWRRFLNLQTPVKSIHLQIMLITSNPVLSLIWTLHDRKKLIWREVTNWGSVIISSWRKKQLSSEIKWGIVKSKWKTIELHWPPMIQITWSPKWLKSQSYLTAVKVCAGSLSFHRKSISIRSSQDTGYNVSLSDGSHRW